jgi:DNA-binding CsgD family transcriptional regulator
MSDDNLSETFVMLCDWRGRLVWSSNAQIVLKTGDLVWGQLSSHSQRLTKEAFGKVVALRESCRIEVTNRRGIRVKVWLWPLDSPEVAVCLLGVVVPRKLETLTRRERDILELLASGTETREIASKLGCSISTAHTHMKRAREKLGLRSVESLISFAARYCYPGGRPFDDTAGSLVEFGSVRAGRSRG